jgi:hypothetical protein
MPTPSQFDEGFIIDWVRKKLGDPTVCVELDETTFTQNIDDTLELFQKYQPKLIYDSKQYDRGRYLIEKPQEDAIGVLDVEFSRADYTSYENIEGALLYDPFYFLSAGGISGLDVTTYDLVRHWTEVISREFGAEEGYVLLDDGRVFIQCPGIMNVTIIWSVPYEGLCDVRRAYYLLFQQIVLAKSRQILGNIRAKYAGVPAAGGVVQMDGEFMRQKGAEEEEKYVDELVRSCPFYIPSLG